MKKHFFDGKNVLNLNPRFLNFIQFNKSEVLSVCEYRVADEYVHLVYIELKDGRIYQYNKNDFFVQDRDLTLTILAKVKGE